jgi:oxygen-independent coproporphyrinogen III oxidase
VLGLRRLAGVDREEFAGRTGFRVDALGGEAMRGFVDRGLLFDDGHTVRLSREGLLVSDALWPKLLRR